jgi:hypothetical protein
MTKQNLITLTLTLVFFFGAGYLGALIVQPGKDRETTDLLLADRDLLPSTLCGLMCETAVFDIAGKFTGQLQVVVDDVFEMNSRSAGVGEQSHKSGLAFALLVL